MQVEIKAESFEPDRTRNGRGNQFVGGLLLNHVAGTLEEGDEIAQISLVADSDPHSRRS